MTSNNPDLGEQALSKVAEVGISSQLDDVEDLNVEIRTDPLKLVQGQVDSVAISGSGMVVKEDLRMETLIVVTDKIAINPLSAVLGNIELTQPADANAQAVLTESDLNRALGSDYLKNKMRDLQIDLDDKLVPIAIQEAKIQLLEGGKAVVSTDLQLGDTGELKRLSAVVAPTLKEDEQRIALEIVSIEGEGLTPEFGNAVLSSLKALLDLHKFELPGMSFHVNKLEFLLGKILIHVTTQIEQLPTM
jgi:LmeA-like phospholipid-binding